MTQLLLTGAGFSRNWGGWLATEAFEYLLGCPEVDEDLRRRLWTSKRRGGGFEDALAELQAESDRGGDLRVKHQLDGLRAAIVGMFNAMDLAFAGVKFEPQADLQYMVSTFLVRFDAIFTLNQDLLLERHYIDQSAAFNNSRRWSGWELPGTQLQHQGLPLPKTAMRLPVDEAQFRENGDRQPYYKLHGSTNLLGGADGRLLIMGGNKAVEIGRCPLLNWYHRQFRACLARAQRLMIIGYSFNDAHINQALIDAATNGTIKIFIIDPLGVDVLNKQDPRHIQIPSELMTALEPRIIGASRRPFLSAFSGDRVEFGRLVRFF